MADKVFSFTSLLYFFLVRFLFRRLKTTSQTSSHKKAAASSNLNVHSSAHIKLLKYPSTTHSSSPSSTQTILFDVEATLFKSSSLFPYFMLVAFEAGSLFRALILLLIYPFLCLIKEDKGIELMVMVCFCGIKKDSFRVGRAVLPKFFLEDVGMEGFQGLMMMSMNGGRRVGVSRLPRVMVEGFLREYLEIEVVVARELKVFKGYYLGLMEPIDDNKPTSIIDSDHVIGIASFNKPIAHLFSFCKEIYLVSDEEKKSWHYLPKDKYPKPLIFHDGRLALRPTLHATLAIFMWFPFGVFLAVIRALVYLSLPSKIRNPILAFTGFRLEITKPADSCSTGGKSKGVLYVCNHRTLLDPLYLSAALLNNKPITAVTYSLSRVSELLAPIKTVRLTRDKQQDAKLIHTLLRQGDVVICPEGTTCREPYLLRMSPLFAEMGDEIVPVALDAHVSMFHGTTAGGLKCLDPVFFAMNPYPSYKVKVLEKVYGMVSRSAAADDDDARFKIANHVQRELAKALGFECTKLTRKDKYLMLAGNEGIVSKI